jgi:hypothetical protein
MIFQVFQSMLKKLDQNTKWKRLLNTGLYVKPVKIALGTREERHNSRYGIASPSV